ncbi:DUF6950 family protein [Actinobacillus vicugnae]|uniref:DUF6950 family protein n=1 Tax=Actinobacillus vicugnae TaxID=2573093 RepID=UPI00124299E1|nr:hypothetical protein [Actinobacillus vicugnae]
MRYLDWEKRLVDVIERHQNQPFLLGTLDCCQFARNCLVALSIENIPEIPNYNSLRDALSVLRDLGGISGVAQYLTGKQSVSVLKAKRGDLLMIKSDDPVFNYQALAICAGNVALATGKNGPVPVSRDKWLKCWEI